MSIITFGLGPGGSFENNAVRFSDMKDATLKITNIEAGLLNKKHNAKMQTREIEAAIAQTVLDATLVTQEISGNLDDKC